KHGADFELFIAQLIDVMPLVANNVALRKRGKLNH
ncbi:MAG: hypothetical protein RLZZ319_27, partial [Actinomycetota bacterium]